MTASKLSSPRARAGSAAAGTGAAISGLSASSSASRLAAPAPRSMSPYTSVSAPNAPATMPPVMTNANIDPPLSRPAATSLAPSHITSVTAPNNRPITSAVITARWAIRCRAATKVASTAATNRPASRRSCPNAWTIRIAPSVSDTIAPTSATRSCDCRLSPRTRRPNSAIGAMMTGMPTSSSAASFGASTNR